MLSSFLLLGAASLGCLSDNPPADCPADCRAGDERPACGMDQAVKRQLDQTWQVSDGLAKHGMMAKKTSAKRPTDKPTAVGQASSRVSPWRRCALGLVWAGAGAWLVTEKNWLARGVGAISAVAGLWVCASAR